MAEYVETTETVKQPTSAKPVASKPKTANQVVDSAYVRTHTVVTGDNLNSSEGLREAVKANATAIRLLADHVDGVVTDSVTGIRTDKNGKPVD